MTAVIIGAWASISTPCKYIPESRAELSGPAWFQTFWEPCAPCCNQTRIGRAGDGGKWICASKMARSPALLSIGSNNDFSFELDFKRRFDPRTIDVYDHTSAPHSDPTIRFHKLRMSSRFLERELKRLKIVDVLKVDCEGCELELFSDDVMRMLRRMKTQILVEVHWMFLKQRGVAKLWQHFAEAGYGPYHKEPNIQFSDGSCVEYALVPIEP